MVLQAVLGAAVEVTTAAEVLVLLIKVLLVEQEQRQHLMVAQVAVQALLVVTLAQ
jgi:hypothetical protein